jgi:hypothetical protein
VEFQWNRSEVLALAKEGCAHCQGFGLRRSKNGPAAPCHCVLRSVFRACYRKFRHCATLEKYVSRVRMEQVNGKDHKQTWGMKNEEYMADFCRIAERNLDEFEHQIFRFHFLLGADWKLCCRKLRMDRGNFFHAVYRIQQKLGRAYREIQPYALFPLDEYFGGATRDPEPQPRGKVVWMPSPERARGLLPRLRLLPPLKKVA